MTGNYRMLVINPGSTSTKIAVFDGEEMIFDETLRHSVEELSQYDKIFDQYEFRKDIILNTLSKNKIDINSLGGCCGTRRIIKTYRRGGTYEVNQKMLEDLKVGLQGGEHASNLGGGLLPTR